MTPRSAGILFHPSSLPGRFGIGDFGPAAEDFLGWMASAGQTIWQILPLGPTGLGNSPYGAQSSFAGNPLLISPDRLAEEHLLPPGALDSVPRFRDDRVDFDAVIRWKEQLLRASWRHFNATAAPELRRSFDEFVADDRVRSWLEDWALYSALKRRHGGHEWSSWSADLAAREASAITAAEHELRDEIGFHHYCQFLFFRQWHRVRETALARGIRIMGDLPIYVAFDSADVWSNQQLFELDAAHRPTVVAGVPPDYFSKTGQRWGNPLYRWKRMRETGFDWWIHRLGANLRLVDSLRIDHFRGFAAYWEIPAAEETAIKGRWVQGPGIAFFKAVRKAFGELPLVAEDLGLITEEVEKLRKRAGLPGMKVLQFAFAEDDNPHMPHRYEPETIVYTGTHDNDTTVGWWQQARPDERQRADEYLGSGEAIHWRMIRAAYTSVARTAIVPLQDILGLPADARMNVPGKAEENWGWRMKWEQVGHSADTVRRMTALAGRGARS